MAILVGGGRAEEWRKIAFLLCSPKNCLADEVPWVVLLQIYKYIGIHRVLPSLVGHFWVNVNQCPTQSLPTNQKSG
jgi:hypothetical protein